MCNFRPIHGASETNVNCIIKTPPTFKICPDLAKLKLVDEAVFLSPPTPMQRLKCLSCEHLPLIVVGICDCQTERDVENDVDIGMETYEPDETIGTGKEPGILAA
jgi:hypothetical protein